MAELVTQDNIDVLVDFYGFALQDEDDLAVPVTFPEDREADWMPPSPEAQCRYVGEWVSNKLRWRW
ncbi:hypothetical protein ABE83_00150 [Streptomyces sp. CFMR 7]|uniref:hypothetical protein n=1 Tax=Streptomyces bacillaris TaxID=68179 RepID=UPI0006AD4808|nr:hypothetical protein ABE83_00150 [Streptomyces sp. CFMR 7]